MGSPILVREKARSDIIELAVSIEQDSGNAASRFLYAVEQTLSLQADFPDIGSLFLSTNPPLVDLQVFRTKGFPNHLIFFRRKGGNIEVVRVIHGARDLDVALRTEGPE
jgi:toxin ParE1/3/4